MSARVLSRKRIEKSGINIKRKRHAHRWVMSLAFRSREVIRNQAYPRFVDEGCRNAICTERIDLEQLAQITSLWSHPCQAKHKKNHPRVILEWCQNLNGHFMFVLLERGRSKLSVPRFMRETASYRRALVGFRHLFTGANTAQRPQSEATVLQRRTRSCFRVPTTFGVPIDV